jgi:DNA (cytosine-5)-methyltransferase 1
LSEGFKQAGFKIIGGIDCDEYALKTFLRNHPKSIGILASIENITAEKIIERLQGNWPDVIVGSPPCQGFTTIAQPKLRSLDSLGTFNSFRNMLYKKFVDIVQVLRPKFFVMENVRGMLTYDNGLIPHDISKRMSREYRIDIQYKNAADYGVPQHRRRVFIIGNRIGVQNPNASPSHYSSESFMTRRFVSVRDAIS